MTIITDESFEINVGSLHSKKKEYETYLLMIINLYSITLSVLKNKNPEYYAYFFYFSPANTGKSWNNSTKIPGYIADYSTEVSLLTTK